MEDELKKIEELHNLIPEHSQDMIIRFTSLGILTYVSPASSLHLGYELEELVVKTDKKLSGLLESELIDFELFIRHKSGKRVEVRTTLSLIISKGNR
ncbi:PAS domain S-box protein [Ammoniphilus sp. 3BR4]|uniref:PAS domain S-box protein n=1 Tax=Ammoniphilus sp. 3BR4 TaxID=3158265 RepID=UPI0034659BBD